MAKAFALVLFITVGAGCATSARRAPAPTSGGGEAASDPVAFWHELAAQPMASNADAAHALLLYFELGDDTGDYAGRIDKLKSRGMLQAFFNAPADGAFHRGDLAFAVARGLGIKGGLNMRLFGGARYALRELEFLGLMPPSSPNQALTGLELVGVISKVQDYRTTGSTDPSAVAPTVGHQIVGATGAGLEWPEPAIVDVKNISFSYPLYASLAPQNPPATATLDQPFTAVIDSMVGQARWTPGGKRDWRVAKKDDVLQPDSIIETGSDAKVVLRVSDNAQLMAVYHLTRISILELRRQSGIAKTDIGVDYGRAEYEIYAPGTRYDANVRAPNDILAVRSTRVLLYEQPPFKPQAISLVGRADFYRKRMGDMVSLGGAPGRVRVAEDRPSAAETALREAVVDPTFANARSNSEDPIITYLVSRGATVSLEPGSIIPVARGGGPFDTQSFAASTFPATTGLRFIVTWENVRGTPNLDVRLAAPGTTTVLAPVTGLNLSVNGQNIPFDHRGGEKGGVELVVFPKDFLPGPYTFGVAADRGEARATFQAYVGRRAISIIDPDTELPSKVVTKNVDETTSPFVEVDVSPRDVPRSPAAERARSSRKTPSPRR